MNPAFRSKLVSSLLGVFLAGLSASTPAVPLLKVPVQGLVVTTASAGGSSVSGPTLTNDVSHGVVLGGDLSQMTGVLDTSTVLLDFGSVDYGATTQNRQFQVLNTGTEALSFTSLSTASPFSSTTDCQTSLAGGQACTVDVTWLPGAAGLTARNFNIVSDAGTRIVTLQGTVLRSIGSLQSSSGGVDFGAVEVGQSVERTFTTRNIGNKTASAVYATLGGAPDLAVTANNCGTVETPLSLGAQANCSVTVAYAPTEQGNVNGTQLAVTGFDSGPVSLNLRGHSPAPSVPVSTGPGTAAWSTSPGSTVEPNSTNLNFGSATVASTVSRSFYLRNVDTEGRLSVGFTITGDTSHFEIVNVHRVSNAGNGIGGCASISNGVSTTQCLADAINSGGYIHLRVDVRYRPGAIGSHSVVLTSHSANGSTLPGSVTFTGSSDFNPQAVWSSQAGTNVTPDSGTLGFGVVTRGLAQTRALYLRNVGTHGRMSAGFTLTGDTQHFAIINVHRISNSGTGISGCASISGGVSTAQCQADTIGVGGYIHVRVDLQYLPTAVGEHSVTLAPDSSNGTVLPGSLTLTGSGEFNPQAVWSSQAGTNVTPDSGTLGFGVVTRGLAQTRTLYLRNAGTHGRMAAGFTLTGDTQHFAIINVHRISNTGTGISGCASISDGVSTTQCQADTIGVGGFIHVRVDLQYLPTTIGTHSVTLMPSTTNGTTLPEPVTLTGTSQGFVGAWSSTPGTAAAFADDTAAFGEIATGASYSRTIYLRNMGATALSSGFTLAGDAAFRLTAAQVVSDAGLVSACAVGGALAADGRSTTANCQAQTKTVANGAWHVALTVQFSPAAVGATTATLTPAASSQQGTVPAGLTLTGTGLLAVGDLVSFSAGSYTSRRWSNGTHAQSCLGYRTPTGAYTYAGVTGDGVYRIQPVGQSAQDVYCDMANGGWTLVLSAPVTSWSTFTSSGAAATGANPILPTTNNASKKSDAFWAAIPGSFTKWVVGTRTFYTRWGTAPWVTQAWHTGGTGRVAPSCSSDLSAWYSGRTTWIADCYGAPTNSYDMVGLGASGHDTYTRKAWVR